MLHNIYIYTVSAYIETSPCSRLFTRYRAHSVTNLIINGAQRIANFVAASSPSHIFLYITKYIYAITILNTKSQSLMYAAVSLLTSPS